jgi:hypothetical protein
MKLSESPEFEKFWQKFHHANRYVSKWDERRTDRQVFVRRALKTLMGKCFKLTYADWKKFRNERPIIGKDERTKLIVRTEYIQIAWIEFAMIDGDEVRMYFIFPHSYSLETRCMDFNFLCNLVIEEAETDFHILRKFYPLAFEEIPDPFKDLKIQLEAIKSKTSKK